MIAAASVSSMSRAHRMPVRSIEFTIDHQPRKDQNFTLLMDASVPIGSYYWVIKESRTQNVVDTSTLRNPTFNLGTIQQYDVFVTVTSSNSLNRHRSTFITVEPRFKNDNPLDYDHLIDLDAITATKGTPFTNSCTVSAVNGATSLTTSAAHGVSVGDRVRVAIGAHFYVAQSGTTGTTLVLDRAYEGPTATVPNNETVDLGTTGKTYLLDGDTLGGTPTNLLDKLGNDTGVDIIVSPDKKIAISGEFPGSFQMQNLSGGSLQTPVHMYNIGEVRFYAFNNSLPYPVHGIHRLQYIVWDGHGDNAFNSYGFQLYAHPTGAGQIHFMQGAFNTDFICTGCEIPYTGADSAAGFSYDPPNNSSTGASHTNALAAGNNSGNSTLVVKNTIGTIPLAGRINISGIGGDYYNYSSFNSGTKTFTLTSTLSTNYSEDAVVNVSICTDYNWHMDNVIYTRNKISSTTGTCAEGAYLFFNTSDIGTNGFRPAHAEYADLSYNDFASTGLDGLQMGSSNYGWVHDNIVRKAAVKNIVNHQSGISWNDGNKNSLCFRNKILGGRYLITAQSGQDGLDCYFHANLLVLPETDIGIDPGTPIFFSFDAGLTRNLDYHWTNNTIIAVRSNGTALSPTKTVQHNSASLVQSLNLTDANNVHIKGAATFEYPDLDVIFSPAGGRSGWLNSNLNYSAAQAATVPKFTDYAGRDYTIVDASSPLYNSGQDLSSRLPNAPDWMLSRDIDGYPLLVNGGITSGCYAGHENFD